MLTLNPNPYRSCVHTQTVHTASGVYKHSDTQNDNHAIDW